MLDEDSCIDQETDIYLTADIPGGGKRAKASKGEEDDEQKYEPMVYAPVPLESDCGLVKDSN